MTLTVILLTGAEDYITYLDPERLELNETREAQGISTLNLTYSLDEDDNPDTLFQLGNKIWVQGDNQLADTLYVINTKVREDLDEHYITLEAEEVLVELNYVPPTSQTYLTSTNFNISNGNVVVDRKALTFWFGDYYNIGVVQSTLSTELARLQFTGTMNLMELLRYIEEETGNRFTTQYEKDPYTNQIHRYLNFLNPRNQNLDWNFRIEYTYPLTIEDPEPDETVGDYDSTDDTTEYSLETNTTPMPEQPSLDPNTTSLRITTPLGTVITDHTLSDAGLTGEEDSFTIYLAYSYTNEEYSIRCQVDNVAWDSTNEEYVETTGELESISSDATNFLPDRFIVELVDETNNLTYYQHTVTPVLSSTHMDILDLGYNVEDLNVEVDETDTYTAVAPVLTASTDEYTTTQIRTITQNWLNLSVTKGDTVPMIIEKVTNNSSSPSSTLSSNYWSRCINNQAQSGYDCWHGTAYWVAPFNKRSGELWIEDYVETDTSYSEVNLPQTGRMETYPKILMSECSDENVYQIYNQLALRLREVRYKEINIETEVANLNKGLFNDYNINDKVYVKIPSSPTLVTAKVIKTTKNPHQQNENTVELSNYSINNKYVPTETYITGNNINYTYPSKGTLTCHLRNLDDDSTINAKLLSITVYQLENGSWNYYKSLNISTDTNGKL